jgi:hypothetical protein
VDAASVTAVRTEFAFLPDRRPPGGG